MGATCVDGEFPAMIFPGTLTFPPSLGLPSSIPLFEPNEPAFRLLHSPTLGPTPLHGSLAPASPLKEATKTVYNHGCDSGHKCKHRDDYSYELIDYFCCEASCGKCEIINSQVHNAIDVTCMCRSKPAPAVKHGMPVTKSLSNTVSSVASVFVMSLLGFTACLLVYRLASKCYGCQLQAALWANTEEMVDVESHSPIGPRAAEPVRRGACREGELWCLLADLEAAAPDLAQREELATPLPDPVLRAEALRAIEQILEAPRARDIFGGGIPSEQKAEFRRLARLLHPDKGLASGERANLALRRLMEAHRSLEIRRAREAGG